RRWRSSSSVTGIRSPQRSNPRQSRRAPALGARAQRLCHGFFWTPRHRIMPPPADEPRFDYASPQVDQGTTRRSMGTWISLLAVWAVGLVIWAAYLVVIVL